MLPYDWDFQLFNVAADPGSFALFIRKNHLLSCSILMENGGVSDAMSTAMLLPSMPRQETLRLTKQQKNS
jgi:hypothetical protein